MHQHTRLMKGESPHPVSAPIPAIWAACPPPGPDSRHEKLASACADDALWAGNLVFDVYALFFLSHFDSVAAKIQPGEREKKAKNFKALNAERRSVSSRKGNGAHVPFRERVFQPRHCRLSPRDLGDTCCLWVFLTHRQRWSGAWFTVNAGVMLKWVLVIERSSVAITFFFSFQDVFS